MRRLPPAWTITATLGLAYVIAAPPSPDLAAANYRSGLFSQVGFSLWDNSWYGGHHLPAYSLLAPALGALIGAQLLAALSMTLATALFAALIEGCFPARTTRIAAIWFAFGVAIALLSSRIAFDLGLAVGLAALLAAQRTHSKTAFALTLLCSLASPVAGAFLALAYLAWALAGPNRMWPGALTAAALAPIALLAIAFPEGGSQPFVASAFYPALAGVLLIGALIPFDRGRRATHVLKLGALLYALALIGSYVLPTAVGGNVDRLGALLAGPLAACALLGASFATPRARILIVLAPLLLYWQANAPVTDFAAALSDPAVHASYYRPLLGELRALGIGYGGQRPARIEVVPTVDHWEARWLAPHVMIARGWERQLDRYRNGLFYGDAASRLTAARYRTWLSEQAVSYVALPDAPLDYSARAEARLLRAQRGKRGSGASAVSGSAGSGLLPYLHEVWHDAHWRLFAVASPQPLTDSPATLTSLDSDSFTLRAPRAGSYTVRVRFTRYWALADNGGSGAANDGCVARSPDGWTEVLAHRPGSFHVVIRFALARVLNATARCD